MIKRKIDNRIESERVFCNDNVSVKGPVTYFPVYMLMFLKNVHIDKDKPTEHSGLKPPTSRCVILIAPGTATQSLSRG